MTAAGLPARGGASQPEFLRGLLHGDPELHGVLGLGRAGPHQLNEEVCPEDAELGVAQLVQRVPERGVCPHQTQSTGPWGRPQQTSICLPIATGVGSRGRQLSAGQCPRAPFAHCTVLPSVGPENPGARRHVWAQGRPLERAIE